MIWQSLWKVLKASGLCENTVAIIIAAVRWEHIPTTHEPVLQVLRVLTGPQIPCLEINCHNPSPSPSKSESKVQVKSPSLSPSQESKSKLKTQKTWTWSDSILLCHPPTHPPTHHHHTNFSQQPNIQLSSNFHSRLTWPRLNDFRTNQEPCPPQIQLHTWRTG